MKTGRTAGILLLIAILSTPLVILVRGAGSATPVRTAVARVQSIRSSIIASGTFLYSDQVRLSPEVLGKVVRIYVREGEQVAAGAPLLQIDGAVYASEVSQRSASALGQRAGMREKQAMLANARLRLNRVTRLHAQGFATKSAVDDATESVAASQAAVAGAEAGVAQAEALLRQSMQNLGKTLIRAPNAGIVVSITTRVGETVVPSSINLSGSSLMTIAGTNAIIAEINVDEADINKVQAGQEVSLTAAAFPQKALIGTVESVALMPGREDTRALGVSDVSTSQARTYSVRVAIPGPESQMLRAGMTCRAEVYSSSPSQLVAVPVEAVMSNSSDPGSDPGIATVYVVRDGHARRQKVRLGAADDRFQAILSGLKPGERVVSGPAEVLHGLADGQAVGLL